MKITVTYNGELDEVLDGLIIKAIESIGGKWCAQGMELESGTRDICFDVPEASAPLGQAEGEKTYTHCNPNFSDADGSHDYLQPTPSVGIPAPSALLCDACQVELTNEGNVYHCHGVFLCPRCAAK